MTSTLEPMLYDVMSAAKIIGLGRSKTWELISTGQLDSVRVGTRRLVPRQALDRFVADLISASLTNVDVTAV